jgi:hypothetical protein
MTKPMADRVLDFVKESKVGCVVTDFSPLRAHRYIKLLLEGHNFDKKTPTLKKKSSILTFGLGQTIWTDKFWSIWGILR